MSEVRLEQLSKHYESGGAVRTVFQNLELRIPLGKITVVVGRSGCGKTTLLRLLGGLETPDSGAVRLPEGYHTTMLYPEPYLVSWATVLENVRLTTPAGLTPKERAALAQEMLDLAQLSEFEAMTAEQLSTGMRQRLALARALAGRSELLLMDEPFAALDFFTRAELQQELLRIQDRQPRTIVFVTHQLDEALLMADRLVVLHTDGAAVVLDGLPAPRREDDPAFLRRKRELMAECMK